MVGRLTTLGLGVIGTPLLCVSPVLAQATDEAGPLIRRLTPMNQLRVIMGLFVVVFLGIFLYIVIKAGSHMVRGLSAPANRLPSNSLPSEDDWAKTPLNESWQETPSVEEDSEHASESANQQRNGSDDDSQSKG